MEKPIDKIRSVGESLLLAVGGRMAPIPVKMSVADSIRYRLLEQQWDDEQIMRSALSRHQKNRK